MSEHKDFYPPVPVDVLPPETRLAFLVHEFEEIVRKASDEQALRAENEVVLHEAYRYVPPLVAAVADGLFETRVLLMEHGLPNDVTRKAQGEQAIEVEVTKRLDQNYLSRPQVEGDTGREAKHLADRIIQAVHPDVSHPTILQALSPEHATQAYQEGLKAARRENPEHAQQVLLETLPQAYVSAIKAMSAQGMTPREIVAANPNLVSEMEDMRWIAHVRLPADRVYRPFGKPEQAQREAQRIKGNKDADARAQASGLIHSTLGDVVTISRAKNLPRNMVQDIASLQQRLERVITIFSLSGELIAKVSNWVVPPYAASHAQRAEDVLTLFPQDIYAMVQAIVDEGLPYDAIAETILAVQKTIEDVHRQAKQYAEYIVAEMNKQEKKSIPPYRKGESFNNNPFNTTSDTFFNR